MPNEKKIALVFPGQASQYVGMGKEFYDKYACAKEIFDTSNNILGYDLKKIIFEGPLDLLTQTIYTQPAVFATSVACFKVFTSYFKLQTSRCLTAGHSLGEYAALVASGALNFETALKLVNKRAQHIQEACEKTKGSMLAVLGADKKIVEELCAEASTVSGNVCQPANFNSPGQIVISGEISAIEKAKEIAKSKKIKTIPLAVSGAFHSPLMEPAAEKMKAELYAISFNNPMMPVISNCDALPTSDKLQFPEKLIKQIASPVLWIDSINKMYSSGCTTFIELGPKNVLSGMIKKISPEAKCINVENEITLAKTLEEIKNV